MKIYAFSKKGINKSANEDRIIIGKTIISEGAFESEANCNIIAIADGVGGNNAGAIASHFVAYKLTRLDSVSLHEFTSINEELLTLADSSNEFNGMATTLSGVWLSDKIDQVFGIGNTRVYFLQGRKYLKQVTVDDTTLNFLLVTGQLSQEDAECFERKNEITACFGGGSSSLFSIKINDVETVNCPIMITSDGIHDYVSIDQMETIIEEHGIGRKTCELLVTAAIENGSCDDMSIVIGEL